MQIMGDWAKGEFTAAGQTPGKDYGCSVLSDHGSGYVMGGDVFAFPKSEERRQDQGPAPARQVMMEPDTQIAFAQKKGSIPARLDVDSSSLDVCAQKAMAGRRQVAADPGQRVAVPAGVTGAVEDVISHYWNDPAMTTDAFVAKVASTLTQPF